MKVSFSHPGSKTVEVEVPPEGLVVGRQGGDADVLLDGDGTLSRRHGKVWLQGGEVWYQDLGSSRGTWKGSQRISSAVKVEAGHPLTLGSTQMSLVAAVPAVSEGGLTLRMEGSTAMGREALVEALGGAGQAARYTSSLYDFVQGLLRSTSTELISQALTRLYRLVPAAQRIALVAWPPEEDGTVRHLVPPDDLTRKGVQAGPISLTLARRAVESGNALMFSDADPGAAAQTSASVIHHGIRSAVYVPLIAGEGEPMGVLCVDSPTPSLPFAPQDFQFIRAVGGLLSTALASEQLRDQARARELEAREGEARRQAMVSFLKIASHDLKNPLAVIKTCAATMRDLRDPDLADELAGLILNAERRAEELIQAYLQVSALESGQQLQVVHQDVDLTEMVGQEIEFQRRAVEGRSGAPVLEGRTEVPSVRADPQKLRQVLANLIGNAVKYSPGGGRVSVDVRRQDGEVLFRVSDQGVGISEEDQKKLFQEFQRVGDRTVAAGTGLGLWLTAALVRAHGGRIGVESEEGRGSTFYFTIPAG